MSKYRERDEQITLARIQRFQRAWDRLHVKWAVLVMIALTALRISWSISNSAGQ